MNKKKIFIIIICILIIVSITIPVTISFIRNKKNTLLNSVPLSSIPTSPSFITSNRLINVPDVTNMMDITSIINNINFFSLSSCSISFEFQGTSSSTQSNFFSLGSFDFGFYDGKLQLRVFSGDVNIFIGFLISPSGSTYDEWLNNTNYKIVINIDEESGYQININNMKYYNYSVSLLNYLQTTNSGTPYSFNVIESSSTIVLPNNSNIQTTPSVLNTGNFVGTMKNFSIYNRPLVNDEINYINNN